MFIGAPTAARASFDGRDRAHTIDHLTSNSIHEANHSKLRDKSRLHQSSLESSRFIKLQERTKTLIFRLLVLGIYITSGAAIFHVIESSIEDEENLCHANGDTKVELEMSRKFNVSMKEIRKIVLDLCDQFEASHRCKYSHNDWSYYQSLYFVGSVVTTIGYGHLAPKTQAGRLFLIFYAFFGIPINLLALQSIGEHINLGFHKLITFTERKIYKKSTVRHEHIKTFFLSVVLMLLMLPIGGLMYYYSEKNKGWTYLDSVYYSFVAMSTIGFGDLVPNEGKEPTSTYEQVMWFIRLLFLGLGLSLVSSVFTSVSGATKQIKTAYMSRKGVYEVNGKRSQIPNNQNSFKEEACIQVKDLLCGVKTERPPNQTNDVYTKFEDSMSTTSLSFNQSQHDDSMMYLENPCDRARSISMALSHASLGFGCPLDWNTGEPITQHQSTSCNDLTSTTHIEMEDLQETGTSNDVKMDRNANGDMITTLMGLNVEVTDATSSNNDHDVMSLTSLGSIKDNIVTPSHINIDVLNEASSKKCITTLTSLNHYMQDTDMMSSCNDHDVIRSTSLDSIKEENFVTSSNINIDGINVTSGKKGITNVTSVNHCIEDADMTSSDTHINVEGIKSMNGNNDVTVMTSLDSNSAGTEVTINRNVDNTCVTTADDVTLNYDVKDKIALNNSIKNGVCTHSRDNSTNDVTDKNTPPTK